MIENEVDIATADGTMNTFICHPDEGGPHAPVLFYMDAPGMREEIRDMARRIASVGYYVMAPNLYYRLHREWYLKERTEEAMAEMFEKVRSLKNGMVLSDTEAMLRHLDRDAAAKPGPLGATGYCMSGPFVFAAAGHHPDRFKATASIHGVALVTDAEDSPHLSADRIQGEMYFGCAEHDSYAPPELIEKLDAHLKSVGAPARIEWYPETEHGFVFPQRPVYAKAAAERHWQRLFAMFQRQLH